MYEITVISLDSSSEYVATQQFDGIPFASTIANANVKLRHTQRKLADLLSEESFDAIVTPGNSFGHMTGGFDGAVVEVFGQRVDDAVRATIKHRYLGELSVGSAFIQPLPLSLKADSLVYAPTMRVPMSLPLSSEAAYVATLAAFQEIARSNKILTTEWRTQIRRVLLPVMGMGTGNLPIARVAVHMQLALIRAIAPTVIRDLGDDGAACHLQIENA